MSIFAAFWGGFSSFYSIWQICAFQISPFFMAFIVGLYFVGQTRKDPADVPGALNEPNVPDMPSLAIQWTIQWTIAPSLVYVAGFSLLYALLSSSGLLVSRYLSYHLDTLRLIAGFYLLLVSLHLIFPDYLNRFKKINSSLVLAGISLLLGFSFAIVYSPCITPTLSEILGLVNHPGMVVRGAVLAFFYGLGLSFAFAVTGLILVKLLNRMQFVAGNPAKTRIICGLVLSILAILNITGLMVYYKAFVLGLLVS